MSEEIKGASFQLVHLAQQNSVHLLLGRLSPGESARQSSSNHYTDPELRTQGPPWVKETAFHSPRGDPTSSSAELRTISYSISPREFLHMHIYTTKAILVKQKVGLYKCRFPLVLRGNWDVEKVLRMRQFTKVTAADTAGVLPMCLGLPCRSWGRQHPHASPCWRQPWPRSNAGPRGTGAEARWL